MLEFIKIYLVALPVFFAIDLLWLGVVARNFYRSRLGDLLKDPVNWPAAIIFYLLFIVGLVIFAVKPGLEASSWMKVLTTGALFGFFTYMTYDLTNLATLKDWPFPIVVVDIIWGIVLSASVSIVTYFLVKALGLWT